MAIKIICDICGGDINNDTLDDNGNTPSISMNAVGIYTRKEYPNVCGRCFNVVDACINDLRAKQIEDNESMRQATFNASDGGRRKINGIKRLRELSGLGLKEAKDMYELWEEKYWKKIDISFGT
jgi:hypothetical protein